MEQKGTKVPSSSAVGCNRWYNNPSVSSLNVTHASWPRDVIHLSLLTFPRGVCKEEIQLCEDIIWPFFFARLRNLSTFLYLFPPCLKNFRDWFKKLSLTVHIIRQHTTLIESVLRSRQATETRRDACLYCADFQSGCFSLFVCNYIEAISKLH